ncbi:MAG TPA: lipid-binding SYLF domain-containing protein [Gammaproteobacteria bacterium]|nr:lipid-binding SYLF domain-containing protein [Gammaproteobacteria bacterium]
MQPNIFLAAGLAAACLLWPAVLQAQQVGFSSGDHQRTVHGSLERLAEIAEHAAEVLKTDEAAGIPKQLVDQSRCIAVFPETYKAGVLVVGEDGDGVISCRDPSSGDWRRSAPVYITWLSGSIGPQIGAATGEHVVLFLNQDSARRVLRDNAAFGAGVGITLALIGGRGDVDTAPGSVVGYRMNEEGAFVGAQIRISVMTADEEFNRRLYGPDPDLDRLLFKPHAAPKAVAAFGEALDDFAPASHYRQTRNDGLSRIGDT